MNCHVPNNMRSPSEIIHLSSGNKGTFPTQLDYFLVRLICNRGETSVWVGLVFQNGLPPTLGLGAPQRPLLPHILFFGENL